MRPGRLGSYTVVAADVMGAPAEGTEDNDVAQPDGSNRFLALTDRLVSWMPSRVEELLERPVDSPRVPPAAAAQRVLRATLVASAVMVALLVVLHLVDQLVWDNSIHSFDADNDQ